MPEKLNKEYDGKQIEELKMYKIMNYKIHPLIKDSKYNIFFILPFVEKTIEEIYFCVYQDESGFFNKDLYCTYNYYFLYENYYQNTYNQMVKCLLVQIPLNRPIKKLQIGLEYSKINKDYDSQIDLDETIENYFYIDNINNLNSISNNRIFTTYLNFFFDKSNEKEEVLQNSLMNALRDKISENNVELQVENILKFFKYCLKFKLQPKNIDYIDARIEDKKYRKPLNENLILSNDDIDILTLKNEKEKMKLLKLLARIYAYYDKNNLLKLIQLKNAKECCRIVLDLLNNKELKCEDLSLEKQEDIDILQKNLLFASKTKEEINYIIKISDGLINSLKFINKYCKEIYIILDKNASYFQWKESSYFLTLANPRKNDDINEIEKLLSEIIKVTKDKKYKIINYEDIFEDIIDLYSNESLKELCKLDKMAGVLKAQKIKQKSIEKYYNAIHKKGVYLIKNKKIGVKEIINFIIAQDYYYRLPIYKNNEFRDPAIFNYIPITDIDKDYLSNIELIKKNNLWELFADSSNEIQKKFYEIILEKMKKVKDFKSLFDIFPIKSIMREFTLLINGKFRDIILTVFDEKEDLIYQIIDNILIINHYNDLELNYIMELLQINYDFPSKYYFYLLKNKNLDYITLKVRNFIINFFLKQVSQGRGNAESLISLLLWSPNNNFTLSLLNQMDNMIVKENDFYLKEETPNFLLFKLFFEKCGDLLNNKEISQGRYLYESILMKNKILNNFNDNAIEYSLVYYLIDENNSFYPKIFVLTDENEKQAKELYEKIKENLNKCQQKFEEFEEIEDFYTTFYKNSKKGIILLIKEKLNELKLKTIKDILSLEKDKFIISDEFDYKQSLEELENKKYKNSCFFMSIYRKKYDNEYLEKSEDEILKESINNYRDTLTRIIKQKDTKEPFFGIDNISDILSAVQNTNNNMEEEMKFIEKEFADLGKKDYIKKDLLNDLINFSIKEKTMKLINGIINFIESYKQISEIQITDFLNNLKQISESIQSNEVSGEEIKKAIDILKKNDYDIKKETSIIKFYELLLGKQESILFIKQIKDSNLEIRNLNEFIDESENSQLQTTDIDNLIDVYTFFKKLMDNKNIKTDEDLLKTFRKEFDNDKDIVIKLQGYLNTYGEIIQLYQSYDENPEMTIQKIESLLEDSKVEIYKDNKTDIFTYIIKYKNQKKEEKEADRNELEELRNKILMSSNTNNTLIKEGENKDDKREKKTKKNITKEFLNLMDNIKQLTKSLNSLQKSGYPNAINFTLKVDNSNAYEKNDEVLDNPVKRNLQEIVNYYNDTKIKFKNSIKKGYETCPYLRLFYGKQLILLHDNATKKGTDMSHLINSVTLNKIKDTNVDYVYNYEQDTIENINKYLGNLFKKNGVNLEEIYKKNKVKEDVGLPPGFYRKTKTGDYSDLISNILNIYLNFTGNVPIINTLLICNEETTIETIKAFLYRALFCDMPVLFLITNMECLELAVTQNIISTLKDLYKAKNRNISSYLLFIYEKVD